MIYKICGCLVVGLVMFSSVEGQDKKDDSLKKFAETWVESFSKNKADELLKFYEQSDKLEVRTSSGVKAVGIKALKRMYAEEMGEVKFSDSKASKVVIRQFESFAVVSFEHKFKITTPDDTKLQAHIQTVMVLKKSDGKWLIVNEHSSTIRDIPRLKEIDG